MMQKHERHGLRAVIYVVVYNVTHQRRRIVRTVGGADNPVVRNIVLILGFALFLAGNPLLQGADNGIAVLVSDNTYRYFQNAYEPFKCNVGDWNLGVDEYNRYFLGWERILSELGPGYTYTVLGDADVSPVSLRKFRVLVLSNAFWLDRFQTKTIAEWVRQGGRLLATYGTGYSGIEGDFLKGGTNGLHELWGDPSGKVNSSFYLGNPWVKVQITRDGGPTNGLAAGEVFDYQYMANILIHRPLASRDINAFFLFNDQQSHQPAVFNNRHGKGLVVYYAFAPEYLISLASDAAGHCKSDTRYDDAAWLAAINRIADGLRPLMKSTVRYLLNSGE